MFLLVKYIKIKNNSCKFLAANLILVALFLKNVGLIRILVYNFINCNESMFCEAILFTF